MTSIKWYGDQVKTAIMATALETLHDGGRAILTEAIEETPILSGTLRRSGTVTDALMESAVYVSFNTPYAIKQHEDLTLNHPDGGKAKYLEDPFNRNKDKVIKMVGARIKALLRGE
jgi:hypothetical protein